MIRRNKTKQNKKAKQTNQVKLILYKLIERNTNYDLNYYKKQNKSKKR